MATGTIHGRSAALGMLESLRSKSAGDLCFKDLRSDFDLFQRHRMINPQVLGDFWCHFWCHFVP
jgi:hypothetical protein